jgi:hypothetical protein
VKKFFCGPESFTPDLSPCVGESPEIKNYFVAAGEYCALEFAFPEWRFELTEELCCGGCLC